MKKNLNYLVPSLGHIVFCIIFVVLIIKGQILLGDGDTGYHIRAGEYILKNSTIPQTDIFSYHDPQLNWTAHEWLAEVIMAIVHIYMDLTGIIIFTSLILAYTFYRFFRMLSYETDNLILVWIFFFFATSCTFLHWLARPHIFSFLFLIFYYEILIRYESNEKNALLYLPLLMVFWVNLHGGYIIGLVLIGSYFFQNFLNSYSGDIDKQRNATKKTKALFFTGMTTFLATMLNPSGYKILLFPFNLIMDEYLMSHVMEFMPTNIQEQKFFKYFFFFSFAVMITTKKRPNYLEALLFILFSYIAFKSVRYTALFGIVAAPIVLRRLENYFEEYRIKPFQIINQKGKRIGHVDKKNKGFIWPTIIVVTTVIIVLSQNIKYNFDSKKYPIEATKFLLKEQIPGNMFSSDSFGDYLIYAAYPKYKVYFDGRIDMYGAEHCKKYLKILRIENGWEDIVKDYNIGWFMIKKDSLLSMYLKEKNEWKIIYSDELTSIYVRDSENYKYLIEKYS